MKTEEGAHRRKVGTRIIVSIRDGRSALSSDGWINLLRWMREVVDVEMGMEPMGFQHFWAVVWFSKECG